MKPLVILNLGAKSLSTPIGGGVARDHDLNLNPERRPSIVERYKSHTE